MLVRVLRAEVAPQARRSELQNSIKSLYAFVRSLSHEHLVSLFSCLFGCLEIALQFVYDTLHKAKKEVTVKTTPVTLRKRCTQDHVTE
jgi:hypothetical protein